MHASALGGGELLRAGRDPARARRDVPHPGLPLRLVRRRARRPRRPLPRACCAPAPATRPPRARWSSTAGRRSTSTTTWTGCCGWPTGPPRSASSGSCWTTAGSPDAARTTPGSATGPSTRAVWPDGLTPLVDHVRSLGMEFGLWVEPEMVNLDSDLARAHPDWVLGPAAGFGPSARNQHVLDIAHPEVFAYLLESPRRTRRPLRHRVPEVGPQPRAARGRARAPPTARSCTPRWRRSTGCSTRSGRATPGWRSRAAPAAAAGSTWASWSGPTGCGPRTATTRVERQSIQRWTGQLLPPELIGAHIGASPSHTTARISSDTFRLTTALFGHPGIEQDITRCDPQELARLTAWTALYREMRPLLHSGRTVRADLADEARLLHGVVAQDGSAALYCWARVATSAEGQSGRVRLPGLAPDARYRVRVRTDLGLPAVPPDQRAGLVHRGAGGLGRPAGRGARGGGRADADAQPRAGAADRGPAGAVTVRRRCGPLSRAAADRRAGAARCGAIRRWRAGPTRSCRPASGPRTGHAPRTG